MESSNIRDILFSFSPNLDLFAVTVGDGRIKIWDTGKAQLQTEFDNLASLETPSILTQKEGVQLYIDYKCMKWFPSEKQKKRKLGSSPLLLGTGGGDVLALDVSAGQLKWRVNNCHPGGVSAISFPAHGSHIYTAGADGMVCEIDSMSGNLLNKFTATSKAISALAISPDGRMIATAASELKIFNSSSHKKLQKFSGHPGPARCMIFSEDNRYVLSSASGERYIAVWEIHGSKNKCTSALLSMDHPAIFLDSKYSNSGDADNASFCILAISEIGVCYFWHGRSVDELRNCKPTKISVSFNDEALLKHRGAIPNVFAGNLQSVSAPASGHVFLAYGLLIKPTFEKLRVHSGTDIQLNVSQDGFLLPTSQSQKSRKPSRIQSQVTALDRSNIDGAVCPAPTMLNLVDGKCEIKPMGFEEKDELDSVTFSMEDRLRSLGILGSMDDTLCSTLSTKYLKGINLDASTPDEKMKATVLSLEPSDAFDLLKGLVKVWKYRSRSGIHVLPWINCILTNRSECVKSREPKVLDSIDKLSSARAAAAKSLFRLSGRLQLVSAQVDKAMSQKSPILEYEDLEDESEDEDVDEVYYGGDDDSQIESSPED